MPADHFGDLWITDTFIAKHTTTKESEAADNGPNLAYPKKSDYEEHRRITMFSARFWTLQESKAM
jgi:hypothetical protein